MKKIFYLLSFIIISGLVLFLYAVNNQENPSECATELPILICGNVGDYGENATEGKRIFNSNCAACHKLDKNMTGPALREIGKKYDTTLLFKFIRGEKSLIKSKEYNSPCVNFPQLSDKDISDLLSYTN